MSSVTFFFFFGINSLGQNLLLILECSAKRQMKVPGGCDQTTPIETQDSFGHYVKSFN